jgi:hypothetical protein
MNQRSVRASLLMALLVIASLSGAAQAGDNGWKPIDPAHLAMKAPMVEKDADVEGLFWEVYVADEMDNNDVRDLHTVLRHYVRLKIFTERGKETYGKVDIEYDKDTVVVDVAGRTIKPDGSIVELKKDAIFDRTMAQTSGVKLKAKSFAMPAVEPGVIIEYRWKEVRGGRFSFYNRFVLQRDFPIQTVKYYLKPLVVPGYTSLRMRSRTFNCKPVNFVKEKEGIYSMTLDSMTSFHKEPNMPPTDQVRAWMLIYYTEDEQMAPEKYWPKVGKAIYDATKAKLKVNDEIRRAATEAVGDATTPEQKLERLFTYCRTKIKNISDDASGLTTADLAKIKENESPADTLKRGMGTVSDIDCLFAALATAAGFEARFVRLASRGEIFFDRNFPDDYLLTTYDIAVKVGNEWRFFDPGSSYVPFGMLRWQEEGQEALIADPKEATFIKTPLSSAEKSMQKRTATFNLTEDGTLEGDVRIEYTGQFAMEKKEDNDDDSPDQREKTLRDMIKEQVSTVEVSNMRIENVTDPVKPFVYAFHVRVPGYAQRTGKRLFVQPAFFQKGIPARFSASDRRYQIYFHYPWKEEDNVTIHLPAGFALDNAESPSPLKAGDVINYDVKMMIVGKNEQLVFKRTFTFEGLFFPTSSYVDLKKVFDMLHERDNHTISLKQAAAEQ